MASRRRASTSGAASYNGLSVSDAKRLKEVSTENARLKKLLAESLLIPLLPGDVVVVPFAQTHRV